MGLNLENPLGVSELSKERAESLIQTVNQRQKYIKQLGNKKMWIEHNPYVRGSDLFVVAQNRKVDHPNNPNYVIASVHVYASPDRKHAENYTNGDIMIVQRMTGPEGQLFQFNKHENTLKELEPGHTLEQQIANTLHKDFTYTRKKPLSFLGVKPKTVVVKPTNEAPSAAADNPPPKATNRGRMS